MHINSNECEDFNRVDGYNYDVGIVQLDQTLLR